MAAAAIILLATAIVMAATILYYRLLPNPKYGLITVAAWAKPAAKGIAYRCEKATEKKNPAAPAVGVAVDRAELEKVFSTFDKDGDGFITVSDLEESLFKLGLVGTSGEVMAMVERLDTNGDGLLDMKEFREFYDFVAGGAAVEEDPLASDGSNGSIGIMGAGRGVNEDDKELREAFGVFDRNGDGLITAEELGMVLASLGLAPSASAPSCRDMIEGVDLDGDGVVCFEEFKRMMRGGRYGKKLP